MPLAHDDYDAVPYPGSAYPDSHPGRMAAMALLHGLDPTPVERCRVLEVGCNNGANLIPMAYAIPGSEFIGFDLAAQPIARAQQRIAELGLSNIRIFQANLMDFAEESELGTFDYIIAHGLYAWIPEEARDSLISLCRSHLTANGIAYISYNALPGGHLRNLVRDILLQPVDGEVEATSHAAAVPDPLRLLKFVVAARPQSDPLRSLLEKEVQQIERKGPGVLYHDEMATYNRPVLFSNFMQHAASHGLQYLSDSTLPPPGDPCYQPLIATVKGFSKGDRIVEEQILDYVRLRMYRETLLCRSECVVDSDIRLESFDRLRLSTQAESTVEGMETHVFTRPGGMRMESQHATTILLMEFLIAASPASISIRQVGEFLEQNAVSFDAEVLLLLLRLIVARMINVQAWTAPVSSRIPERPRASAVCLQEAAVQSRASTLLHMALGLDDPLVRHFLLLLDGTRDRSALLQALCEEHPEMPRSTVEDGYDASLRLLHRAGALLAKDLPDPARGIEPTLPLC